MVENEIACRKIEKLIYEINEGLYYLYISPCIYTRNMISQNLQFKLAEVAKFHRDLCGKQNQAISAMAQILPSELQEIRSFTIAELAKYNGKNGNPAYVAVNGAVYDVTNNAAWAAATHFGFSAGKESSKEFESCHAGQTILNNLKVIGKLV